MKKHGTEEKLLEATLRLISEKGYLGATTREIAQGAGVTELTLFRHFGSKERLFEEVLSRYTFLPKLKKLLPELEELPYDKALRILGIRFLETLKERKPLVKIMLSEVNLYPDKIRFVYNGFIDELIQTLGGYFKSLQKREVIRRFSPEIAARAFLGMIFSYFLSEEIMAGRNIDKKEMEKMIRKFTDIFIRGTLKIGLKKSTIDKLVGRRTKLIRERADV
ncbi:MAG: TetR/AcrR family transcriptional regulator [Thermodesulfovibrionales bacterium]|nr:TetR/AcrR family transcriptional regulator [Thermodesulfovibrionales bacterium]